MNPGRALLSTLRGSWRGRRMRQLFEHAPRPATGARPVLFWIPGGMAPMVQVEGAIAAALRLRGVPVHLVLCDGPFAACVRREVQQGVALRDWPRLCPACRRDTAAVAREFGLPFSFIGDFLGAAALELLAARARGAGLESLERLEHRGAAIGCNVRSAVLRHLKGRPLAGNEEVVPAYAFSGLAVAEAADVAIRRLAPARVFMSHGIYADWGPALRVALTRSLPVTAWMASYLDARFYFRHVDDVRHVDFHALSAAAWEACRAEPADLRRRQRLAAFSDHRYHARASFDMPSLHRPVGDRAALRARYGIPPGRPVWGVLCHINWDCVADYAPMAYADFDAWIGDTVREICAVADVEWLVKVHPAEAVDNPQSGARRLIERNFPDLPPHVRVLPAEEELSPLDFYDLIDGAATVYGTGGLEMALRGKPVILAGEAHYGGKGFTHDGLTPETYRRLLRGAARLGPLDERQANLAERYGYCYFIRRQIPFPALRDPRSPWWRFQHARRGTLLPGANPFVDFVCERILDGRDFVMDDGLVALADRWSPAEAEG